MHATKVAGNPKDVVAKLASQIGEEKSFFKSVTSRNTWVKIFLDDNFLLSRSFDKHFLNSKTVDDANAGARLIIDYASPNMAKGRQMHIFSLFEELHPGHLRSMLHGSVLEKIMKHQGYNVTGVSHTGDFGTPIGQVVAEVEIQNLPLVQAIKAGKPGKYSLFL